MTISTAQIGKCGELLVQLKLLRRGIESAPMGTDTGIDLVVYSPKRNKATTVQVKANLKPKPSGGKGKPALDWWLAEDSPAELIALVDLSSDRVWLLLKDEVRTLAQQKPKGRMHLYMYTDPSAQPKKAKRLVHAYSFEQYLLENRAHAFFGV